MATLVELAAEVYAEIGLTAPTIIVGNSEEEAIQLRQFLDATGKELVKKHRWQVLRREVTFGTSAQERQINLKASIPDYDRMVPDTMFNRTLQRKVSGPMLAPTYQANRLLANDLCSQFMLRGSYIYLVGNTTAGSTIAFEYITRNWVVKADGETSPKFTADSDENILDDRALVLGAKWRVLRQMGQEYNSARDEYERYVRSIIATDFPTGSIDLNARNPAHGIDEMAVGISGDFVIPNPSAEGVVAFVDDLVWQAPGDPDVDGNEIDWS